MSKDKKTKREEIIEKGITLFQEINDLDNDDARNEVLKQIAIVLIENGDDDALDNLLYVKDNQRPYPDQKWLSISGAMDNVSDENLLEYLNAVQDVKSFVLSHEPPTGRSDMLDWKKALQSAIELEGHANSELFERVQLYNNDIQKLKEAS